MKLHLWTPDKITAMIIVVGCLVLIFTGRDGEVKAILATAAGWLFGKSTLDAKGITK